MGGEVMSFQPTVRPETSPGDDLSALVRNTAQSLWDERSVDAGLGDLAARLESADGLSKRLPEFLRAVRERADALEQAALDVRRLGRAGLRLREILPFTGLGWPEERDRLERLSGGDPETAIAAWLEYADRAAGDFRLDALHRLVAEGPLPPGYDRIRDRAGACLAGLQQRRYHRVAPFFADAVDADVPMSPSSRTVTGPMTASDPRPTSAAYARADTARRLRLLLARLCVVDGRSVDLDRWLANSDDAAAYALKAAAARIGDNPDKVAELLAEARLRGSTDLDVVSETARQALLEEDFDRAREVAAAGIAALPTLFDVEHDLGKLVDPPSELWLAVAYRADSEGNVAALENALVSAELRATGGPNENRIAALVADWRSERSTGMEQVNLLRDAGERWTSQGELAQGRDRYDRALQLLPPGYDELWAALTLRWADCVTTLAGQDQSATGEDPRRDALAAVLLALAVPGAAAADPWCHAVEFDARAALSARIDETRVAHLWHGLRAAAYGVARMPYDGRSWSSFADAAGMVGLRRLAIAAGLYAKNAFDDIGWSAAMWASNSGSHQLAIDLLGGTPEPWGVCLTADTYLRSGAPAECARLLSTVPIDPSWTWAQASHVSSVLLTRGATPARTLATRYLAEPNERPADFFGLVNRGFLAVAAGDLDLAESCLTLARTAEIAEDQAAGSFLFGLLQILRAGDRDEDERAAGQTLMVDSVAPRDRSYVEGWAAYEREVCTRLLAEAGVPADVLKPVNRAMKRRRAEDIGIDCAVPEQAREVGVPAEVVDTGLALADVLITLLDGDAPAARAKFQAMDPDLVADLDPLLVHLEYLCLRPEAGAVLDLAAADDTVGLHDAMLELLSEDPGILGSALYDEALERGVPLTEVDAALERLADDGGAELAAREVVARLWVLRQDLPSEESFDLRLSLPASWFEGYTDPVATHPIFERYLPELRELHPELPSVQVLADEDLEPGYFQITDRDGTLLTAGAVVAGARTCDPATIDLLPTHLVERRIVDDEGRAWFPAAAFSPADRVARMLTMGDQEYAVHRLLVSLDAPAAPL